MTQLVETVTSQSVLVSESPSGYIAHEVDSYDHVLTVTEKGDTGTNGGYTDSEISDDVTIQPNYSYRANSVDLINLTLNNSDFAEAESFEVIGVGLGGWKMLIPNGVTMNISGSPNQATEFVQSQFYCDWAVIKKVGLATWTTLFHGGGGNFQ